MMKRILAGSILGLSLLAGVASADRYDARAKVVVTGPRVVVRTPEPVVTVRAGAGFHGRGEARVYRDFHNRPPVRYERVGLHRRGFTWVRGEWAWSGGEWAWVPGHYVRVRAW